MNERRLEYDAKRLGLSIPEWEARLTPIGRRLEAEEIVPMALLLASTNRPPSPGRLSTFAAVSLRKLRKLHPCPPGAVTPLVARERPSHSAHAGSLWKRRTFVQRIGQEPQRY